MTTQRGVAAVHGEWISLPHDVAPYKQTAIFTESTVPAGLLRDHRTAPGVWALIHVLEGRLLYRISDPGGAERAIWAGDRPGVIEPERLHSVKPLGAVCFYVEFYRRSE